MGNNRTKALPTVEINGSKYSKIAERIKFLADEHQYSITTDVEFLHELNSWKAKAVLTIQENDDVFTVVNCFHFSVSLGYKTTFSLKISLTNWL